MKKLFLTLAAFSALTFTTVAQNNQKQVAGTQQGPVTPETKADKETTKASAHLNLTEDQKAKFKVYALDRIRSNRAIREKMKTAPEAEKPKMKAEIKANNDKFFTNVNSILNADQQVKWADHKKKMQEKHDKNQAED